VKVKYADLWLATGGREAAANVAVNGTQVVDIQQLFNATAVRPVARGNKADTFSFSVRLLKTSLLYSERFILSHLANLPGSGQLEAVCGRDGDQQSFFLDAVLQSVERTYLGLTPAVRYTFVGGLWTENGETIISEEGDVLRGKVALTAADTAKVVSFLSELGAPPTTVHVQIVPPDDGDFIDARPVKSTITESGFTTVFAAAIPAAGYELHWTAVK
jgi:hypothetical protein